MIRILFFLLFSVFFTLGVKAQFFSSKLIDVETQQPVPFATIKFSDNIGVMSNEEGVFEYEKEASHIINDSLEISSLGYKLKKISLKDSLPTRIELQSEIFKIAPVVLTNAKITADEIIDLVADNLSKNHHYNYSKSTVFIRETFNQYFSKIKLKLEKSSIDNINQKLFDSIINKFPKNFTALLESYGDSYLAKESEAKMQVERMMLIQSKHEKASVKGMQEDFLQMLRDNTKPNSYLVIKTGIITIDKTESIDSITKKKKKKTKRQGKEARLATQKRRNKILNNLMQYNFINKDTEVDVIHKNSRYDFTKVGYVELDGELIYVLDFTPRWRAKYKGRLYINTNDYAVIKAEIQSAKEVFDKQFNMFGVKSNVLSFKSTLLYEKDTNNKYHIKYMKKVTHSESGIDRSFKVIEKNKIVKGRNTQNKVSMRLDVMIKNKSTKELVFNKATTVTKSSYDAFKNQSDYTIKRFNSYDKSFWKGYPIITPENAIRELTID